MKVTAIIKKPIKYHDRYSLVVRDNAAGRRDRYTVYSIPSSPSRKIRIIGRELPFGHAMRVASEET